MPVINELAGMDSWRVFKCACLEVGLVFVLDQRERVVRFDNERQLEFFLFELDVQIFGFLLEQLFEQRRQLDESGHHSRLAPLLTGWKSAFLVVFLVLL